jgi:hypothetical protein
MPTAVLARQIAARRLWAVIPMYAARAAEHRNLLGVVRTLYDRPAGTVVRRTAIGDPALDR